jgi:hypothetical protein
MQAAEEVPVHVTGARVTVEKESGGRRMSAANEIQKRAAILSTV